jgi:mannose/fructose/N-acetylgalactosamine-specific phosphotransferase system component IIB
VVAIGIVHTSTPSTVQTANESVATNKIRNSVIATLAPKEYVVVVFTGKLLVVLIDLSFLINNQNFSRQFAFCSMAGKPVKIILTL